VTRMRRLTQSDRDCWATCVAMLARVDRGALPALSVWARKNAVAFDDFRSRLAHKLLRLGWTIATTPSPPQGWAIAVGEGHRGIRHAVVVRNGVLWHDPHPDHAGLKAVDHYEIVIRRATETPRG